MKNANSINTRSSQDDYMREHPDAVKDIEKARAMAEAGDEYETRAVQYAKDARDNMERGRKPMYDYGDYVRAEGGVLPEDEYDEFDSKKTDLEHRYRGKNALELAKGELREASRAEEEAGREYEQQVKQEKRQKWNRKRAQIMLPSVEDLRQDVQEEEKYRNRTDNNS